MEACSGRSRPQGAEQVAVVGIEEEHATATRQGQTVEPAHEQVQEFAARRKVFALQAEGPAQAGDQGVDRGHAGQPRRQGAPDHGLDHEREDHVRGQTAQPAREFAQEGQVGQGIEPGPAQGHGHEGHAHSPQGVARGGAVVRGQGRDLVAARTHGRQQRSVEIGQGGRIPGDDGDPHGGSP
jgi:hypothetical protein